ncbi:hypothetical protein AB0C13_21425 [Streptomyces sp. NPDC049099]
MAPSAVREAGEAGAARPGGRSGPRTAVAEPPVIGHLPGLPGFVLGKHPP